MSALVKGLGVYEFDLMAAPPQFVVFLANHLPQLGINNIPQKLWSTLYRKLSESVYIA